MPNYRPKPNPDILRWARTTARITSGDAAKKLQVTQERLVSWEDGSARPTTGQLRRLANRYGQPLALFFLASAPQESPPPHDFRTFPGEQPEEIGSALINAIHRALEHREVLLELKEDLGEPVATRINVAASLRDDPEDVGKKVRRRLGVTYQDQKTARDGYDALRIWREAVERLDTLVFQARRVPVEDARGFSLLLTPMPVVVLNGGDWVRARLFTLLHEFAHIVLGQEGICNLVEGRSRRRTRDQRVEAFCNGVAAAALVPASSFINHHLVASTRAHDDWSDYDLAVIAKDFSVSSLVVLRRLLTFKRISHAFYERKQREVSKAADQAAKNRKRPKKMSYTRLVVSNLGKPFVTTVIRAHANELLSTSAASSLLGIKVGNLPKIQAQTDSSLI